MLTQCCSILLQADPGSEVQQGNKKRQVIDTELSELPTETASMQPNPF